MKYEPNEPLDITENVLDVKVPTIEIIPGQGGE